jgi:hypothetical protein
MTEHHRHLRPSSDLRRPDEAFGFGIETGPCPDCNGTGGSNTWDCEECAGEGWVLTRHTRRLTPAERGEIPMYNRPDDTARHFEGGWPEWVDWPAVDEPRPRRRTFVESAIWVAIILGTVGLWAWVVLRLLEAWG